METARLDWYLEEGFEPDEVWIPLVAVAVAVAARRAGADDRADGLVAEAEGIARSLRADEQASLLVALAAAVPPDRAPALIGAALQRGRWSGALPALVRLAPGVVLGLADDHLAAHQ